jgi:uncharacterized protein
MASGLAALFDDVAALTKLAAASLDDVGSAAIHAGGKSMAVVVDDAAVTPRYVVGLTPDRELPIIGKIAVGSLRNKLLILLPAALVLGSLAPWAVTPLLMIGAAYLCFEGAEKALEAIGGHSSEDLATEPLDAAALEARTVAGAVRTDFILSAEIMAIAMADVAAKPILIRGLVLAVVGIALTVGVYGAVALIVKMDDVGLHLARRGNAIRRTAGRWMVLGMPLLMRALSTIGTVAMLYVGGGIILHGLDTIGWRLAAHAIHGVANAIAPAVPFAGGLLAWIFTASCAALAGFMIGGVLLIAVRLGGHAVATIRRSG